MRSGNICAYPKCKTSLIVEGEKGKSKVIGEAAHIVGEKRQGPRGDFDLSDEDRNKAANLVFLCPTHHTLVDGFPRRYSVAVMRQMKFDHEERIRLKTQGPEEPTKKELSEDRIHATLFKVIGLPAKVYVASCSYSEKQAKEVAKRIRYPKARNQIVPFLLNGGRLYCFHDPRPRNSPFYALVDRKTVDDPDVLEFAGDQDGANKLSQLLNSALRTYLARKRVVFDKAHKRFFFVSAEPGERREIDYTTLTGRAQSRNVVWQPIAKKTNEPRNFWLHLAAALRFNQLSDKSWGLSVRIERHVTTDGTTPYPAKYVGAKVTRLKANMRNHEYLGEVHFWRDFLSENKPRIILSFGVQSCIIESDMLSTEVRWPGVSDDTKPFTNVEFGDDLFSLGELMSATGENNQDWDEDDTYEDE